MVTKKDYEKPWEAEIVREKRRRKHNKEKKKRKIERSLEFLPERIEQIFLRFII